MRRLLPGLLVLAALGCEEGAPEDSVLPDAQLLPADAALLPADATPVSVVDAASLIPDASVVSPDGAVPDMAFIPDPDAALPPDPILIEIEDGERVDLMPPEPVAEPTLAPMRPRRRMNIDQLDAAMLQVSGGIKWTEPNRDVSLFQTLSATLGKPNYIQITTEDLEPSALFQKFLDDAARSVCVRIVERDLEMANRADRVLLRHVGRNDTIASNTAGVDDNLQYLLQRWHGRVAAVDAPELAGWRWLFESATFVSGESLDGWNAVCVGLFVSPDFYTY